MGAEGRWRRATAPPEETETINISTWNIRNGRNGGLYSAAQALDEFSNVDIAVAQETKFTEEEIMHARNAIAVITFEQCRGAPTTLAGGSRSYIGRTKGRRLTGSRTIEPRPPTSLRSNW